MNSLVSIYFDFVRSTCSLKYYVNIIKRHVQIVIDFCIVMMVNQQGRKLKKSVVHDRSGIRHAIQGLKIKLHLILRFH